MAKVTHQGSPVKDTADPDKKTIIDFVVQGIGLVFVGVMIVAGFHVGHWLWGSPKAEVHMLICLVEPDGAVGHCAPWGEYFTDSEPEYDTAH